jgi:hypothetical protein
MFALLVLTIAVCRTASAQSIAEHEGDSQALQKQVDELRQLVAKLSTRVDTLETQLRQQLPDSAIAADPASSTQPIPPSAPAPTARQAATSADLSNLDFRDTTINVAVDTYYDYNFNHPVGRVNPPCLRCAQQQFQPESSRHNL